MTLPACPVCSVPHAACGAGAAVTPVDIPLMTRRRTAMADLDLYDVTVRGFTTQMKLSAEDAETFGDAATKVGSVKPAEPQPAPTQPWAATVDESGAVIEDDTSEKKAPASRNKARTATNKG